MSENENTFELASFRKHDEKHAATGARVFKAYCAASKLPKVEREQDYSVTDAILSLLHFAIREGHDVESIMRCADNHLEAETVIVANCAKCGSTISEADLESGEACTDEGTGPEEGNKFTYCSQDCLERH